jgi:ERCC4-type nuclease
MVEEKLDFGDYAIKDHPDLVVVERKQSVIELCGNLGKHRDRFERELQRMVDAGVKRRYIVVEQPIDEALKRQRFSRMHPNAIFGSIMALQVKYNVHFIFAGSHDLAHRITRSLLLNAWKYRCEGIL